MELLFICSYWCVGTNLYVLVVAVVRNKVASSRDPP